MPIPYYKCDKCKRAFDRFEDAEGCEATHLLPVAVEVKAYSVKPFPYSVEITFHNGEKRIYNADDLGG